MARIYTGPIQRALVLENPADVLDEYLDRDGVSVTRLSQIPSTDELIERLRAEKTQVIFKRSRTPIPRRLVESCPDLLAVYLCCIGDDSVDKQACADNGVLVFNDPVSNGRSVVELVITHLISLSRRLYVTNQRCNEGHWDKNNQERYEVLGKRVGVLGLGNIGRSVARICSALGMEVLFFDTRQVSRELGQELGWKACDSIEQLFRSVDYLPVHLSAKDVNDNSNADLLPAETLSQLGADRPENSPRIFLNLSRGFIHTTDALCEAVSSGRIRRAAVDVYPSEPKGGEAWVNPYHDLPQIAVTPHIGASTQEAQPRIAGHVAKTFVAFSRHGAIRDCVFRPRMTLNLSADSSPGQVILAVVHGTARGTKRAIDEAIYQAGASNLASVHKDFVKLGVAYDLALIDHALDQKQLESLVLAAAQSTGDSSAIRSIRQIIL